MNKRDDFGRQEHWLISAIFHFVSFRSCNHGLLQNCDQNTFAYCQHTTICKYFKGIEEFLLEKQTSQVLVNWKKPFHFSGKLFYFAECFGSRIDMKHDSNFKLREKAE